MEYQIDTAHQHVNLPLIEASLRAFDPAAMIDVDADGRVLRVAADVSAPVLAGVLNAIGFSVAPSAVRLQPSTCCGGCGG